MTAKTERRKDQDGREERQMLTTAIHIRRDHWELLREVAFSRARATGGRASVSAVIGELIEKHKAEIARTVDKR